MASDAVLTIALSALLVAGTAEVLQMEKEAADPPGELAGLRADLLVPVVALLADASALLPITASSVPDENASVSIPVVGSMTAPSCSCLRLLPRPNDERPLLIIAAVRSLRKIQGRFDSC